MVTYVSAFYKIYNKTDETYLENFCKFAEKGYNIVLFLDQAYCDWTIRLGQYPNLKVLMDLPFESLPLVSMFPKITTSLPEHRKHAKDTYEYIIMMNSKLELIKRAFPHISTKDVAWIDFGILKIIKNTDNFHTALAAVSVPDNKILIPGCHEPSNTVSFHNVEWRFCGGIFFGTQQTLEKFHNINQQLLSVHAVQKHLTWEVNIWALIEKTPGGSGLFDWYKADHNDSIAPQPKEIQLVTSNSDPAENERRVMVVLMIKNESKIIQRCIQNALAIADAICISDTGSTDNTVQILNDYLPSIKIPAKVIAHTWKNFGHNRTLSYLAAQEFTKEIGWNPNTTYALVLDADMNFAITPQFNKNQLTHMGYRIIQKSPSLEYYNTRFMKIVHPWRCTGVTHEYWDGGDTHSLETVYINDIGDGGAKDDKFERDARLLRQGLVEEPNNERYMFYLAQTLKDLRQWDEAIGWFKKRIDAGGWYEEVWYSMYQISRVYFELNKLTEMEYWGMRAYDHNKNRSENLYFMTQKFRERSQHHKAWHYMQLGKQISKPNELLFLEVEVYNHLFDYEKTILNYYIEPHRRREGLMELINYYNNHGGHCYSNMEHYTDPIKHISVKQLPYKQIGDYVATSTSMLRQPDNSILLNVRYVNYRIQHDGSYLMMENGILSRDHNVKTRNFVLHCDANMNPLSPMEEMVCKMEVKHHVHIQGLEDVRIYRDQQTNLLKFIATTMEHSYNGKIRQLVGDYDIAANQLINGVSIRPPGGVENDCEKNWIPLGNNNYIYGWHPYRIGSIQDDKLVITSSKQTPRFFEHMRGSSNVVEYNDALYALTHVVMYTTPRKYYHQVVRLNKTTYTLEAYTNPFYFCKNHIEYCLGIDIKDNVLTAIVSQNDSNPVVVAIDFSSLQFNQL